jgi:hypothetical protein
MRRPHPGHYLTVSTTGEAFKAFVPAPEPPLVWSAALRHKFDAALPAEEVSKCLGSLERFLNDEPEPVPPLLKATGLTAATVNKSLAHLERIRVVGELTNRQRGRVFSYGKYVQELAAEMEPP